MKRRILLGIAAILAMSAEAFATPVINVGSHDLLPGVPGQTIPIIVTGDQSDYVDGLNFTIQVNDGGPDLGGTQAGPKITYVDLIHNTIFRNSNTGQTGGSVSLLHPIDPAAPTQLWDVQVRTNPD